VVELRAEDNPMALADSLAQSFRHKERRWEVCAGTASCCDMDFDSRENADQDEEMMEWEFAALHSCNQDGLWDERSCCQWEPCQS
jgi:hypothetical protein